MKFNTNFWIKFSLLNLLIVAILGALMRYKIGFDFPYFSQKYILHAHSHFAFAGWVTHSIYVLIIYFVSTKIAENNLKKYHILLIINLVCAYGMLVSFFLTGYSFVSISLSTLSVINNSVLAYYFFNDFKKFPNYHPSVAWFKAAIWFNLISALGTFYLAYMMASRNFNEHWYLASIYFYLHFQYNGFFTFSCMGLAINKLPQFLPNYKYNKILFILFLTSCIPAYFLSVLWAKIPMWLYILVTIAAVVQIIAWALFVKDVIKSLKGENYLSKFSKFIFVFVALAFSGKLILQLGSTHPELSKLAFGFRPVVIAYLHLVLLAVISVFLLGYFYTNNLIVVNKKGVIAISVFLVGVFLNELVLGVQGIASFSYFPIKYINEMLFVVALILVIGATMMLLFQRKKQIV